MKRPQRYPIQPDKGDDFYEDRETHSDWSSVAVCSERARFKRCRTDAAVVPAGSRTMQNRMEVNTA